MATEKKEQDQSTPSEHDEPSPLIKFTNRIEDAIIFVYGIVHSIVIFFVRPYLVPFQLIAYMYKVCKDMAKIVTLFIQALILYLEVSIKFLQSLKKENHAETIINGLKNVGTAVNNVYGVLVEKDPSRPWRYYPPGFINRFPGKANAEAGDTLSDEQAAGQPAPKHQLVDGEHVPPVNGDAIVNGWEKGASSSTGGERGAEGSGNEGAAHDENSPSDADGKSSNDDGRRSASPNGGAKSATNSGNARSGDSGYDEVDQTNRSKGVESGDSTSAPQNGLGRAAQRFGGDGGDGHKSSSISGQPSANVETSSSTTSQQSGVGAGSASASGQPKADSTGASGATTIPIARNGSTAPTRSAGGGTVSNAVDERKPADSARSNSTPTIQIGSTGVGQLGGAGDSASARKVA